MALAIMALAIAFRSRDWELGIEIVFAVVYASDAHTQLRSSHVPGRIFG